MCNKQFSEVLAVVFFFSASCVLTVESEDQSSEKESFSSQATNFMVPLLGPGNTYSWEVTQSWKEDATYCEGIYPYNPNDPKDRPYDQCSHSTSSWCEYGWDFNLPGSEDRGRPVLASADGSIHDVDYSDAWGNYVVIDHGNNICTRYAHMLDGSTSHLLKGQDVCQGLKIGEIGDTGGSSEGNHLHFQFEHCDAPNISIWGRFTDGNDRPICTKGSGPDGVFDSNGEYNFLKLTDCMLLSCDQGCETFGGGELSEGGWYSADCGSLSGCPLIPNCGREAGHVFPDDGNIEDDVAEAAAYLYSECALDGDANGELSPLRYLTRAEALKVPLFLYGLMNDCGSSEPFVDVEPGEWYFEVVACAVRHGIVNSVADYFHPNDEVLLAEAAKFVVESASKAGVIEIQDPAQGHFPNIPKSHWAYRYIETLYHYGFPDRESLGEFVNRSTTRGSYFKLVAFLSPCYCRNVRCESGCQCDQSVFACVDPNDNSSGTGGGNDSFEPDVSISCCVDVEDTQCVGTDTVLQVECDVTNDGDEAVNVNDLRLTMDDPSAASVCTVTDDDYRNGVGYNIVSPGETDSIPGHFDITCSERPLSGEIDVSLDLTHSTTGPDLVFEDVASTTISVPTGPFAGCYCEGRMCGVNPYGGSCGTCNAVNQSCDNATGQCVCTPDDCTGRECGPDYCGGFCGFCATGEACDETVWQCVPACVPSCAGIVCGFDGCGGVCNSCPTGQTCNASAGQCEGDYQTPWNNCDPNVGYTVFIGSPGGTYEIAASGSIPYVSGSFASGTLSVYFDCIDLPASILIHGGPQYVQAFLQDTNLPDFSYWAPFSGSIVINPSYGASGFSSSTTITSPNVSLLVRTPNL